MTKKEQYIIKLEKLSDQREKNVNRYILPLEIKMVELREKIRKIEIDEELIERHKKQC